MRVNSCSYALLPSKYSLSNFFNTFSLYWWLSDNKSSNLNSVSSSKCLRFSSNILASLSISMANCFLRSLAFSIMLSFEIRFLSAVSLATINKSTCFKMSNFLRFNSSMPSPNKSCSNSLLGICPFLKLVSR